MGQGTQPAASRSYQKEIGPGAGLAQVREIGPLLLANLPESRVARPLGGSPGLLVEYVALHFLPPGRIRDGKGATIACAAGDLLMVDAAERWWALTSSAASTPTLFLPRRSIAAALPARPGGRLVRGSAALEAVRSLMEELMGEAAPKLSEKQQELAAQALTGLVLAALAPSAGPAALRREAGLLERAVAVIDAEPGAALDTSALCAALGCSRSALYRAAAPAGGVAELIVSRRLAAVRRRLDDPADRRSITAIALDHGFGNAVQFGRRFKRQFGMTAGSYREARAGVRPAAGGAQACS